jgi:hypothetical protein
MNTERCAGCDQAARVESGGHPIVAVVAKDDAAARGFDVASASARGFVQVPVCQTCHEDPAHRVFPIKGHFFERSQAGDAVRAAGSNSVGKS